MGARAYFIIKWYRRKYGYRCTAYHYDMGGVSYRCSVRGPNPGKCKWCS